MKSLKLLSVALLGALLVQSACEQGKGNEPKVKEKENITSVTDCQGHTYPVVKIGEQFWMAENLQCTKFDSESKHAGEEVSSEYATDFDAIFYMDGRYVESEYSYNLTQEQRSHLGLLYSWSAAIDICPNGWHLPSKSEWNLLGQTIANAYDAGSSKNVGTHMKTKEGWCDKGYYAVKAGDNASGFSALPAGEFSLGEVGGVGGSASFWTSKAYSYFSAYYVSLSYLSTGLSEPDPYSSTRTNAKSVRCVMN